MGFFGKSEPSDDEISRAPPSPDVEKKMPSHDEGPSQPSILTAAAIDPELERRVLRKLDLRLPTLMAFFCAHISQDTPNRSYHNSNRKWRGRFTCLPRPK